MPFPYLLQQISKAQKFTRDFSALGIFSWNTNLENSIQTMTCMCIFITLLPQKHQRSREKLRKCCYSWKVFFIIAWVHVGWFTETWFLKGVFVIKLQLSLKVVSLIAFHLHLKLFCCYTWLITCITVCIWHYEAISNLV